MNQLTYAVSPPKAFKCFSCVYLNTLHQSEEKAHLNVSLELRFHELEVHYTEATSLLHLQGTLILDLQVGFFSHSLIELFLIVLDWRKLQFLIVCIISFILSRNNYIIWLFQWIKRTEAPAVQSVLSVPILCWRLNKPCTQVNYVPATRGRQTFDFSFFYSLSMPEFCPTQFALRDQAHGELSHGLCLHLSARGEEVRALHCGAVTGRHACRGLLWHGYRWWVPGLKHDEFIPKHCGKTSLSL